MNTNGLSGFLLIDKEKGITSHDVIYKVRKILKTKQVGHAGTLDPLATGLLIVGVGNATKFLQYIEGQDKKYEVEAILGKVSDSLDIMGNLDLNFTPEVDPSSLNFEQVNQVLNSFLGEGMQMPPQFSALKINGKKAYELARQGIQVKLEPRSINIFAISKVLFENGLLRFTVHCTKGTYIRSLISDIGEKLGTGALVSSLRRIAIGEINITRAEKVEEICEAKILPIEQVCKLDVYNCTLRERDYLKNGREINIAADFKSGAVLIFFEKNLICVANYEQGSFVLKPKKVFI